MAYQEFTTEEFEKEEWKQLKDWMNPYEVSNLGRVRRIYTQRLLSLNLNDKYITTYLCNKEIQKTVYVAILVASVFLDSPTIQEMTVNHIDGVKHNNKVENLEWATYSRQQTHAIELGLRNRSFGYGKSVQKLDDTKVIEIIRKLKEGIYYRDIAREYGVSHALISSIKCGHIWKHIPR